MKRFAPDDDENEENIFDDFTEATDKKSSITTRSNKRKCRR
jgi:hypothetical protein